MPYQQQTRDSFYKGRQAYNPSIQAYKEAKEQDVEDAKFMKDMEATGKDYRDALIAWDKNAKALDDEAVNFWKQVSPTMTKLVGETLPKALEMKEKADIDAVRVKWRESPPEDRAKLSQEIAAYAENQSKLEGKRGSIADKARSLDPPLNEYATYIDGLNKTQVTWIHLKLLREKLPDFERNLQEQLADKIQKGEIKPNDFVEQRAFIEEAKKKMFPTVNIGGIRNDILNAQIYKDVDSLGEKWMVRQRQQVAVAESEERVLVIKDNLLNGLRSFDWNGDPKDSENDLGTLKNVVNTLLDDLRYENSIKAPTNPNKAARQDLFNMLAEYEASFNGDEKETARSHIRRLLTGNKGANSLLVSHRGENGKLKSLSELGKGLTYRDYLNSSQRSEKGLQASGSINSANPLLNGVDEATVKAKAKAYGADVELERWDKNPPDDNYRQQYTAKAKTAYDNGVIELDTYLEILNWEPPGVGPSESKSIIEKHLATKEGDGPLYVLESEKWLLKLDEETLAQYQKDNKIRIVEKVFDDEQVETILAPVLAEIDTSNYKSEHLIQQLRAEVKNELHARLYPGTDATGEKGAAPDQADVAAITSEIVKAKRQEILKGKGDQTSEYYLKDGVYVNQMQWQDNWFSRFGKDKKEKEALQRQLALRNAKNLKSGEDSWKQVPIFNANQLIDANKVQINRAGQQVPGTSNYLDNDFIDTALELGVNPWQLYNAQRELLSEEDKKRVPKVEEPEGVRAMKLSNNELKTLGMLLKEGDGRRNYFHLNKAAARILDRKLLTLTRGDEDTRYRPNQRQLLKVLNRTTDGTIRPTTYDQDGRIGQYAMDKEVVTRMLAARGKTLEDFKSGALQKEIAEAYISELSNEVYGDGRIQNRNLFGQTIPTLSGKPQATILKDPGPLVRQLVSKWKGEEYDPNNPTNIRELSQYNTLIRGGSL